MPCYHFHLEGDAPQLLPTEWHGPDLASAKSEALRFLSEVLRDQALEGREVGAVIVRVTDDASHSVFTLDLLATSALQ